MCTSTYYCESLVLVLSSLSLTEDVAILGNLLRRECKVLIRAWNGMEDDFSIFHTGNFLPFHLYYVLKIFHSILKFSSIFCSILPYQGKFRPKATPNLHCTFATLSVPSQVVACEGKQYGTMYLIPYLKHCRNELP